MNSTSFLILAYVVAIGLLWGFALLTWLRWRHLNH